MLAGGLRAGIRACVFVVVDNVVTQLRRDNISVQQGLCRNLQMAKHMLANLTIYIYVSGHAHAGCTPVKANKQALSVARCSKSVLINVAIYLFSSRFWFCIEYGHN